jgi:hypothetical protein
MLGQTVGPIHPCGWLMNCFFACAEASGDAASPKTTKNVATTTTNLSLQFVNVLLFLLPSSRLSE